MKLEPGKLYRFKRNFRVFKGFGKDDIVMYVGLGKPVIKGSRRKPDLFLNKWGRVAKTFFIRDDHHREHFDERFLEEIVDNGI